MRAPARETPPATEPDERTERPAEPAEKEAERALQPAAQAEKPSQSPGKGWLQRHQVMAAVSLAALLLAAAAGYVYLDNSGHFESTDDAFIAARQFSIAPKVSGYIVAVPVTDNQHVVAGDTIARIDDRDYRVALAQAEAQVAAAEANIHSIDAQTTVQQAQVAQAQAQVEQAQAGVVFAQQQASRYQSLARTGSGSVENAQQYTTQLRQQDAGVKTAQAALTAAERQIDALKAQRASAEANLAQANAQLDQAKLNLSYTIVAAAQPGRVVNLSAAVGEYATPGTSLSMFVPDDIWVTANFKETQLDAMRPNQPVKLEIDAYPNHRVEGHVASVQPGSGTAFSLLPAENATGNYVKIVQRVPVKIVLDNPPADVALGPGMSVVPTVRTNPAPSLYERLRARL
ncbi:MAG: HlyD family secretion protein [Roseiarcus sp.]